MFDNRALKIYKNCPGLLTVLTHRRCCGTVLVAQSYPVTGKPLDAEEGFEP